MGNPGRLFRVGISVFGLSGPLPAVAQDIYKWVDDAGLVNYADEVPANVRAQLLDQRVFNNWQRDDGPVRPRVNYNVVVKQAGFDPNALPPAAAGPAGDNAGVAAQNR
ncbi:MAG: DUF4124 domain-containing protein [Gammaproteobacteria bacterium]|jgi:hypothetical protein